MSVALDLYNSLQAINAYTAAATHDARLTGRKRAMERCRMLWCSQVATLTRETRPRQLILRPSRRRGAAVGRRRSPRGAWLDRCGRRHAGRRRRPPCSAPSASPTTATDALSSSRWRSSCSSSRQWRNQRGRQGARDPHATNPRHDFLQTMKPVELNTRNWGKWRNSTVVQTITLYPYLPSPS